MGDVNLTPRHAQLETSLSQQNFGEAFEGSGMIGHIADNPIAVNLHEAVTALGGEISKSIDLYRRFGIWLVPIRANIVRRKGLAEVVAVGIECEFLNGKRTCCVIDLAPRSQYIQHGAIEGEFRFTAGLSATGELLPRSSRVEGDEAPQLDGLPLGFSLSSQSGISAQLSLDVATPSIQAVGIGGDRVEWQYQRSSGPLFGRDIEGWAILALPASQTKLQCRVRLWCTVRTFFFPTRHESTWENLVCSLG